jgi:hypothetical protein
MGIEALLEDRFYAGAHLDVFDRSALFSWGFYLFDTAGEVSFVGTNTLTNLVFKLVPNVNRVQVRLRQQ